MEIDVDSLESSIRKNGRECTNAIVSREEEFLEMLDKLKGDLKNHNTEERIVRISPKIVENKISYTQDSLQMTIFPERVQQEKVIIYKKPQVNSTISMIDQMKKELKKN